LTCQRLLGPHEREEIERHLEEIDATFDFLDGPY
jgi:hypothetical protein